MIRGDLVSMRPAHAVSGAVLAFAMVQAIASRCDAAVSRDARRSLQSAESSEAGPATTAPTSGRRQQATIGTPFASRTLTTSRFRITSGFYGANLGTAPVPLPLSDLDITVLSVKTEPMGVPITPQTWQKDADPIFIWQKPSVGLDIAGYSYAVNATPDETVDTTSTSWDVAQDPIKRLGDGKHAFSVKAINTAGKSGKAATVEVWVDTSPPTIQSYSPAPGTLISSMSPTISAVVLDPHSGVSAQTITLLVNGSQASASVDATGAVSASVGGLLRDGRNSIELRASDLVGNAQTPLVWSVVADRTPPSGTILINAGASSTTSVYVTLNLTASDETSGVTRMMLSNDPMVGYVEEPFTAARELWRLNAVRGRQRVYAKFIDAAGNVSAPVMDEIELLLLAPDTLIVSGPAGATAQRTATFLYSCPEESCVFSYAFDDEAWSEWSSQTSATRANLPFGNHYFKVKAAKESNGIDGIQPDEEDPTPAERTWIVGVEPRLFIPRGSPIKLWRIE